MIVNRVAAALDSRFTLKEAEAWEGLVGMGRPTAAGQTVSVERAMGLIPVFACMRVIAESIGVMPCHVYRRNGSTRSQATDVWQYGLFHEKPNPEMAPGQFVETLLLHLTGWGNTYMEKVGYRVAGSRRIGELWPIEPGRVAISRDNRKRKVFEVDGETGSFTERDILHIPALVAKGEYGLSPVGVAREELGVALARQQWQGSFYRRGATHGGVIERPKDAPNWTPAAAERFKDDWAGRWGGVGAPDAGGTPVLEDGMTYRPISMPLRDQQFIEQGNFTAGQIAGLFNVRPSRINAPTSDSMTYGNREQDAIDHVVFTCLPWMTRLAQGFWRDDDLFPSRRFYPLFRPEALMQGDHAARAAFYEVMNRLHVLSANDIAELEDREPRAGNDDYFISSDTTTPKAPGGGSE